MRLRVGDIFRVLSSIVIVNSIGVYLGVDI